MMLSAVRPAFLAAIYMLAGSAYLRGSDAVVAGRLTDSTGASVQGGKVVLKLKKCSCNDCPKPETCGCCPDQRSGETNDSGRFEFSIPAGDYEVILTVPGFKIITRQVELRADQRVDLDVRIE